jgi:Fic family protein
VKIHPFGDGNGRIARMITNFILHKKGFPLMVIEYKNRKSYYRALRKSGKEGETIFVRYFTRRYLAKYRKYLR